MTKRVLLFALLAATSAAAQPTVYPWIEINDASQRYSADETYAERAVECLHAWGPMVDRVIVTTHSKLQYAEPAMALAVKAAAPAVVWPGVQTNPSLVRDLGCEEGWAEIAKTAVRLIEMTGSDTFVLNNENAMIVMRETGVPPDWEAMARGVRALREALPGVRFVVYPSISCWTDGTPDSDRWHEDDLKLQTKMLHVFCDALEDVTLVTFDYNGPRAEASMSCIKRQQFVEKEFRRPTLSIVYFYPTSKYYWHLDQFDDAYLSVKKADMTPYLGCGEYKEFSRTAAAFLRTDLERRAADGRRCADQLFTLRRRVCALCAEANSN